MWKEKSILPHVLMDMTPSEFSFLFLVEKNDDPNSKPGDRWHEMRIINRERGLHGKAPIVPSWLRHEILAMLARTGENLKVESKKKRMSKNGH